MMDKTELIESIIYKYFAGTANEVENQTLAEWLKESNENRIHYFEVKRIWLESENNSLEINTDTSWERLKLRTIFQATKETKGYNGSNVNFRILSLAATILILIGVSSILGIKFKNLLEFDQTIHEISVPLGARTNITLPDGTNVWLNAGSTLSYKSGFGRRERSVFLTGEAFFDIDLNANSVFTVNTRDLDIRVHGTQFNIKSYPEEDITETTLVSGKIEIQITDERINVRPFILSPKQKMTYSRNTHNLQFQSDEKVESDSAMLEQPVRPIETEKPVKPGLVITNVTDTQEYTSWKDGKLTFRSESLKMLAPKLERYYNIQITFRDDSIKDIRYTGTLDEITIEEVLRAISIASEINYKIVKNHVILSK